MSRLNQIKAELLENLAESYFHNHELFLEKGRRTVRGQRIQFFAGSLFVIAMAIELLQIIV